MSEWSALIDLSPVALLARWTVLLMVVWVAHQLLSKCNPRWRVALWRSAMIGLFAIAILTFLPPVARLPVVPAPAWIVAPSMVTSPEAPSRDAPSAAFLIEQPEPNAIKVSDSVVQPASPRGIVPVLILAWAIGVLLLTARLALATVGLTRLIARARPAPELVVERCRAVASAMRAPLVRVVCSNEMPTPCLAGLSRPVLLLPADKVADADLPGVLAHELAHAKSHDLAWNLLAHAVTILLWFHPLVWKLRYAHAAACDAVCDAIAADYLGDVDIYARTLARMALAVLSPPPKTGLAMARSSDIGERVHALRRRVFGSALPRSRMVVALASGFALLLGIGGLAFTAAGPVLNDAPPADSPKANPLAETNADGRLEIQTLDQLTGQPIEGVAVTWELRVNGGRSVTTKVTTATDGRAALEWNRGATVNDLAITARKPGLVPYKVGWDDKVHPVLVPAVRVVRLAPGTTVGGVVTDEAGEPVAGARVCLGAPGAELDTYDSDLCDTVTDARGRWRLDDSPADLAAAHLSVTAPGFLRAAGTPARDLNSVIVLKRGFKVTGRVVDGADRPIVGAKVSLGNHWSLDPSPTRTDSRGEFALDGCPPGASVVTVMADGFAPDLRNVLPDASPSLEFRLEPGHTVRGRVIDPSGRPIRGLTVRADGWRGHGSLGFPLETDEHGHFEWRSAPRDTVTYFLYKSGYIQQRGVALSPGETEHTITINPELVISGNVTDASTGKPLPVFRVIRGGVYANEQPIEWSTREAFDFTRGRYSIKNSEPCAGYAVRIEAAGYRPMESRLFKPNEGSVKFDCSLELARTDELVAGTILDPDGNPATGVEVALSTPGHRLTFEPTAYRFARNTGLSLRKSEADGRFSFPKPKGPYLIAALNHQGYVEVTPKQLAKADAFMLIAWGKIKGEARIGNQAAADMTISVVYRNFRRKEPSIESADYRIQTRTDPQGRFAFDRVIPGANEVSRVMITNLGQGATLSCSCWQEPTFVEPGQTVAVRIGGKGRAVVGRVVLQQPPGMHVDLRQNQPVTITRAAALPGFPRPLAQDPHLQDMFAGSLEKDGRFRVDDVPPGNYELTVLINGPPNIKEAALGKQLARVVMPVIIPVGEEVGPIDLGEIVAEIKGP